MGFKYKIQKMYVGGFLTGIMLFHRAGRAFLDSRSRVPGVLGTRARDFF